VVVEGVRDFDALWLLCNVRCPVILQKMRR